MNVKQLAPNVTLITFRSGLQLLYSYSTPVAGHQSDMGYFRTKTYYSSTTSRHINNYLGTVKAQVVDQSWIDNLVNM